MKDKSNQPEKDSKEGSTLQIAGDLVAGLLLLFFITILVAGYLLFGYSLPRNYQKKVMLICVALVLLNSL